MTRRSHQVPSISPPLGKNLLLKWASTAALAAAFPSVSGTTFAQTSAPLAPVQQAAPNGVVSPNAEARLEALRHALIEKALKSATRIRSAAWVDETGTLRENVQINSDVRLRGIRILSYLDQSSPEQARMVVEAESSANRLRALNCSSQPQGQRLKRHAAVFNHFTPSDGRHGYYFMPELAAEAEAKLVKLFALDDSWVLTPARPSGSTYEQVILGRYHDMPAATPYTLRINLEPADAAQSRPLDQAMKGIRQSLGLIPQTAPALPVRISLQVEDRSSGRVLWRNEELIDYPEAQVSMQRLPLPIQMRDALEVTLRNWQKHMRQALACEPLRFEATLTQADQFTIAAGSRAGIREGDQLLLVDWSRFLNNMLEKGSLDKAALIEIQSVSQDQSLARRVAGPPPASAQSSFVAMPL